MAENNGTILKTGEKTVLASLTLEVDNIFFSLRKADQIIRRELNLLNQHKYRSLKKTSINPIDAEKFKALIDKMPPRLLVDDYIIYMFKNENKNSIFNLIKEYNAYLDKRQNEPEYENPIKLIDVDEKLVYYIRNLGAMAYHLNIHLNLLTVLLKNASVATGYQDLDLKESQEIVSAYMVKEWGDQQGEVRFIEITIDGSYAIVTWALEDHKGDAILIQDEGYWQLMNISASMFGFEDFENAGVPLAVAQRMLSMHHQKLGY